MIDILIKSFEKNATKTAIKSSDGELTYAELMTLAQRYARDLQGSNTPVIVRGNKEPFMLAAFVACIMTSRAYIPCEEDIPLQRLEYIRDITGSDITIDKSYKVGETLFCDYRNDDNDTAYIIFTSGSTGKPKGVPISRGNLKNFVHWVTSIDAMKMCSGKNVLNQARFSFDLSVADIYFSLCTGSTLCVLTSAQQKEIAQLVPSISEFKPSLAVITPTFAKYCLCFDDFNADNLPDLETVFFCGEQLEPRTAKALFRRFPKLRIINAYGPTEATCAVSASEITPGMCDEALLPAGELATSAVDISIDDNEIVLDGKSVFNGYIGQPKLSGKYFTGDNGELRDGRLYCLGRKHGYIKFKGYRIEPDEIREAILSVDGVLQCEITTAERNNTVVSINATVVCESMTENEIKTALKEKLPDYMIPKSIRIKHGIGFNNNFKQSL